MNELNKLAARVIKLAAERHRTVGTAESLTAGLIAATLADISGASRVLMGGIVSYDPRIKRELLGVSATTIDSVGVVSEACARQMAEGARHTLGVDIAVSATGVAGPLGGTDEIPVGTVFVGCATDQGTVVEGRRFDGDRQTVRQLTVAFALEMVLQSL